MTDYDRRFAALETNVIHAGRPEPAIEGAIVTPVFQSANYLQSEEDSYDSLRYVRMSNSPNHHALHKRLAVLEGTEAALVTSSGMAAITGTVLAFARAGEHVIAHQTLYGGMQQWLEEDIERVGISCSFVDGRKSTTWSSALRPNTRIFYLESITNPLMEVLDLRAAVQFAKENGLVTILDNTFASPVNCRPHEIGIDVVCHSATKYLNGHSDIVAGAVAGSRDHVERVRKIVIHMGGCLDPHAGFLLERGLKTLALRVQRQNANAMALAKCLRAHPKVRQVNYPGLDTDPGHELARSLFSGYGGMLSFFARNVAAADRFLSRLRIPVHAGSLGGVETLVVRPTESTHAGLREEERVACGITAELIRVSVGIEDERELVADFVQALDGA